jgi:hypothetical protein
VNALKTLGIGAFVALIGMMIYLWGHSDGRNGTPSWPLRRWLETAGRTTGHLRLVLTCALHKSLMG